MKKWILLLTSCLAFVTGLFSQSFSKYVIEFTDKNDSPFSLSDPSVYLSSKALLRREKQSIAIDSSDLPVNPAYIDSVLSTGAVNMLVKSKWLNAIVIRTSDANALNKINSFLFVKKSSPVALRFANNYQEDLIENYTEINNQNQFQRNTTDALSYGQGYNQVHIHNGEYLHNLGYQGQGMTIAILDAGFLSYQTNPAFDSLRISGRILGTWDFVNNEPGVNEDHIHGAWCLSSLAGNIPGVLVGSGPQANYYLFRTEDASSEQPIEEYNWAAGAEMADSLGVDMISSSLGYSTFDNSSFNYTYAQMDGKTTTVSKAASYAASKGILVTNSAGNEGGNSWKYIIAPADGMNVLTVGAIATDSAIATFSSYGPSADGRIKPDVVAIGQAAIVATTSGAPAAINGTSFSNPNLAGLVACLWQAFPDKTNLQIMEVVRKSANRYTSPDDRFGYGIPDFYKAYRILYAEDSIKKRQEFLANAGQVLGDKWIKVFPVPFHRSFTVLFKGQHEGKVNFTLYDASGRLIQTENIEALEGQFQLLDFKNVHTGQTGIYFLKYDDGKIKYTLRLSGR